ncbi:MAG: polyprenyl synthetase family protein [Candidatus Omnitrophica bacterium]|nr:polyprenyl synthetase family protein [Candidatus Omnitrophota bacterium]
MLEEIKKAIENQLIKFSYSLGENSKLVKLSPLLYRRLKEFILRPGKRLRPILFVLGYLAYSRKPAKNYLSCAVSLELLHDFLLIHDDIVDRSPLRRGKLSLHTLFENDLKKCKYAKIKGEDLALICGDILYALCLKQFLAIKEDTHRKDHALREFLQACFLTGCGEFLELEISTKDIWAVSELQILRIYDLKTAYYSFAYPLTIGAILGDAARSEIKKIFAYGTYVGRAFQIYDDILGMFAEEETIGKSSITDLAEAKKTLLIWYAYQHLPSNRRKYLTLLLRKKKVTASDLKRMRKLLVDSAALTYCQRKIVLFCNKADKLCQSLCIPASYKNALTELSHKLVYIPAKSFFKNSRLTKLT